MAGSNTRKASTPSKAPSSGKSSSTKRNKSILNFFQKTDSPQGAKSTQLRMSQFVTSSRSPSSGRGTPATNGPRQDTNEGLFLEDKKALARMHQTPSKRETEDRPRSHTPDDIWGEGDDFMGGNDGRYNENESSVKRRKVSSADGSMQNEQPEDETKPVKSSIPPKKATSGPFIDESDSEDDLDAYQDIEETTLPSNFNADPLISRSSNGDATGNPSADAEQPPLVREATNYDDNDEYENFDDYEGEDEFLGDEFREQIPDNENMDGLPTELCPEDLVLIKEIQAQEDESVNMHIEDEPACPSCMGPLGELNEQQRMIHVNDCLDGKPNTIPLSKPKPVATALKPSATVFQSTNINAGLTRLERAAVARPAQRDPYSQTKQANSSAFSKMMAGNAEDTAWANAAAHEVSSRGKQAYQRTCPFYKIMNGFSICVDAFRYGAVEGCNAYFLSHFHSDHYIGLSKSWSHGPIYCSRATGNLVRQQLRVDPKWVVDLDFETTTEVPNTEGVQVTMIQANHCPGSALFVFEKNFGSGPNIRRQRILHCGDFRASPDHVRHPLLCPNPINPVTRQPRQQRLDQCYLDTTYLSPKYAFPSQESVITACAELCVRLNEEAGVGLEFGKSGAGGLMNKFLSSVTSNGPKEKPQSGGRLLVVIGTYSIGKERICMGIARALGSKIFATPQKQRICSCLEDPELSAMLTSDPKEAQVHMQTLFEIRADTLADYLDSLKPHFSRVVGFRPTGWSYRPPAGRMLENPPVPTVLRGEHWKTPFTVENLTPQRGSTRESSCFGVPYSEHSSFRELTMFCCALRIGKVIPTVNVGSQKSRDNMKIWMERWEGEKKRNGLFPVEEW
ncbi:DNA cross-link repair protein pso2/snm1 [Penicillium malachiteum]|uniref:DNA cross-link repair protein pso2/snm1 n=1 Tax=Penicillium malachiteum TaxID=1324776 RepID=UPI002547F107|nr:DNA cross-link repair protein pso2/snm1 [Penicillium malachiteum]KAJ5729693.1 DNA cross-link repair protein pso2/snm1 [Penicillium malachiteum]